MVSVIEELEASILENSQNITKILDVLGRLEEIVTVSVSSLANYQKLWIGYGLITIGISLFMFGLTFVILQKLGVIQVFKRKGKIGFEIKRSEILKEQVDVVSTVVSLPETVIKPEIKSVEVKPEPIIETPSKFVSSETFVGSEKITKLEPVVETLPVALPTLPVSQLDLIKQQPIAQILPQKEKRGLFGRPKKERK